MWSNSNNSRTLSQHPNSSKTPNRTKSSETDKDIADFWADFDLETDKSNDVEARPTSTSSKVAEIKGQIVVKREEPEPEGAEPVFAKPKFESSSSSATPTFKADIMYKSATPKTKGGSWEDLRKEARQLENQIDLKLVSFSKLGTNFGQSKSPPGSNPTLGGDKAPLLGGGANSSSSSEDQIFESASLEISDLLARLAQVNDGMSEYASKQSQSAAVHHTLQRHRDILQDYRQEFTKTRSNIEAMIEREDLLTSVHRDINDYRSGVSSNAGKSRMDLLLRESESARNSERLIDDQINIAIEARETLVNQRLVFKTIQTKLNDLAHKFPAINNLVQKINLRKRRDSVILGVVIGLCLLLLLWYTFG